MRGGMCARRPLRPLRTRCLACRAPCALGACAPGVLCARCARARCLVCHVPCAFTCEAARAARCWHAAGKHRKCCVAVLLLVVVVVVLCEVPEELAATLVTRHGHRKCCVAVLLLVLLVQLLLLLPPPPCYCCCCCCLLLLPTAACSCYLRKNTCQRRAVAYLPVATHCCATRAKTELPATVVECYCCSCCYQDGGTAFSDSAVPRASPCAPRPCAPRKPPSAHPLDGGVVENTHCPRRQEGK